MLDPTLLDLLTEVVRHIQLPAIGESTALTEGAFGKKPSGFTVKPGAQPPAPPPQVLAPHKSAA